MASRAGIFVLLAAALFCGISLAQDIDSGECVNKGWSELGKRHYDQVYAIMDECIGKHEPKALLQASKLGAIPSKGKENIYKVMNDVAVCYFIKGEAFVREKKKEKAEKIFEEVIKKYPYALAWDPRGWFWSVKEKAEITLRKIKTGKVEENVEDEAPVTYPKLINLGSEFPVDYSKYGEFISVGAKDYQYKIKDYQALVRASGEGVYPDNKTFRKDPAFIELKKIIFKIDHWKIFNSRDLNTAFYRWCIAPEPTGVRQFYIANILERSGYIKQAIKAYYAVIVFFPQSYGWTYWHTPWYIARASLSRIKYLLKQNPKIGYKLEGASVKILNGFDNSIANDVFVVNPGRFVRLTMSEEISAGSHRRNLGKVVQSVGSQVKLVRYQSGDWQLRVRGRPFIIKAVTYAPTRVGESPDEGTLADWTRQDINKNNLIDGPYESWVDRNLNNKKDKDEKTVGDFKLMRSMGVNTIRLYHQPYEPDVKLLREMYDKYGIMVIMGDFLGKYALGSGATWEKGTNYSDPKQQEKMLESVKGMVKAYKDEPFVLVWLLGNENVYGLGCNADKDPVSFFKFANRVARAIKEIDPTRPVAIASGDELFLDVFAKYCPDIDIFGSNIYRGKYGFGSFWRDVKELSGKAAMITEYGAPAYGAGYTPKEAEDRQAQYHKNCWNDIMDNAYGRGAGNALGGVAFEFIDEWWKAYEPAYHDKKGLFSGPFIDGYMHEEWLGLCSQGNGKNSPFLRVLRKTYFIYKNLWKRPLD